MTTGLQPLVCISSLAWNLERITQFPQLLQTGLILSIAVDHFRRLEICPRRPPIAPGAMGPRSIQQDVGIGGL
jgi:hypothetical protein